MYIIIPEIRHADNLNEWAQQPKAAVRSIITWYTSPTGDEQPNVLPMLMRLFTAYIKILYIYYVLEFIHTREIKSVGKPRWWHVTCDFNEILEKFKLATNNGFGTNYTFEE